MRFLGIRYCILEAEELREAIQKARARLPELGYPDTAPYRRSDENRGEWELGTVFCFDRLPENLIGTSGLFEPTQNAIALEVVGSRSLLVEKRCERTGGSRITWGEEVNRPWGNSLRSHGVTPWCLTSRSLGTLDRILRRIDELQSTDGN
ncbi:MAG: hypothetical protein ACRELS_13440 [Candidatus Rokuibacteriota bacterium]